MGNLSTWMGINTRFGWIIPAVLIIMMIFASIYVGKSNYSTDIKAVTSKFILTAVLFIPFLFMDVTYIRLGRVYMILMYIVFVNEKKNYVVKMRQGLSYLLFIVCVVYAYMYEIVPVYNSTLGTMLKYNSLFP